MKPIVTTIAGLAVLLSTSVLGQGYGDKPAATGATTSPVSAEQSVATTQNAPKLAMGEGRRNRVDADARHCLDLSTNLQIIRCAEKYR